MSRALSITASIAAAAIGLVVALFGNYLVEARIAPDVPHSVTGTGSLVRAALLYGVMLLGIIGRELHEYLGSPGVENDISRSEPPWRSLFLRSTGLIQAVIVSPIVFFGVYKAADEQPDHVVAAILAFQNGFFWKTIFEKQKKAD
jgi:hypothetical protein